MLTVKKLRKVAKFLEKHKSKNIEFYFFIAKEGGERYGLKDGQLINNDTVQVIFMKKLPVQGAA